jgi:hypothetical protein
LELDIELVELSDELVDVVVRDDELGLERRGALLVDETVLIPFTAERITGSSSELSRKRRSIGMGCCIMLALGS